MRAVVIAMLVVLTHFSAAQSRLIAVNQSKTREVSFRENNWVRVKTADKKHTGRIRQIDQNFIQLRQDTILLSDILKIKRQPILMTLTIDGFLAFAGMGGIGMSVGATLFTGNAIHLLGLIPSGLVLGMASLSPNPLPALKDEEWVFRIE